MRLRGTAQSSSAYGTEPLDRLADRAAQPPEIALLALGQGDADLRGARCEQPLARALRVARDGVLLESVHLDEEVRVGVGRQREAERRAETSAARRSRNSQADGSGPPA